MMKAAIKNKGIVLIAVLWTAVLLTVMAAVLGRKSRLDMNVCLARMEAVRCKWACRAGIEKAMAVLKEDDPQIDSLQDTWSNDDEDFNNVPLTKCWFNVQVTDETSKLNINTATKDQLMGLPNMVEDVADAIIDWRDADDTPSGLGVESGYYESLPYGYMAANGPFKTIRELLLVKGVTDELFYGEDTNLNGRLDYNENDGNLSPPPDNANGLLDVGWAAYLTCYPSGNTQSSAGQSSGTSGQGASNSAQSSGGSNQNAGGSGQSSGGSNQASGGSGQSSGGSNQVSGGSGQNSGGSNRSSGGSNQSFGGSGQASGGSNQNSGGSNQGAATGANQSAGGSGQTTSQSVGKVNINTASDIVLAALLGGGDEAENTAEAIISYRESATDGIQNISELSQAGVVSSSVVSQLQNYVTTHSNIFTIRCTATADRNGPNGTTLYTEAVVDRSATPCKILYWYQEPTN
jgi:type II secretory pathway component PulK